MSTKHKTLKRQELLHKGVSFLPLFMFVLLVPLTVMAAQTSILSGLTGGGMPTDPGALKTIITNVTDIALVIAGIAAISFMVWGGVTMVISAGDPEKITKGKSILLAAIVGIILIILAKGIAVFLAVTLPGMF